MIKHRLWVITNKLLTEDQTLKTQEFKWALNHHSNSIQLQREMPIHHLEKQAPNILFMLKEMKPFLLKHTQEAHQWLTWQTSIQEAFHFTVQTTLLALWIEKMNVVWFNLCLIWLCKKLSWKNKSKRLQNNQISI